MAVHTLDRYLMGGRAFALLGLVVVMVGAACGGEDEGAAPSGEDVVLIGSAGPLSEPGGVQGGIDMQWAIEAAVRDLNAKGGVLGKKIDVVYEDDQGTPDVGAALAKKFVEEDRVVAFAGGYHSGVALAMIPVFSKAGLPAVFAETYSDAITAGDPEDPKNLPPEPPTIFRIAPTSSMYDQIRVDWMKNGIKAQKVVQIYEATDYGVGANQSLKANLDAAGIQLVAAQVELNQPDYSSVLARLAKEHGDADVAIFDMSTESSFTAEQNAIDVGLVDDDTLCYVNEVARNDKAFWATVPDGAGCVFQFAGPVPANYNDLTRSIAERYEAAFGRPPPAWVFEGYDAVLIVVDAIKRAESTDPKAITTALENTSFEGAQGRYEFRYGSGKSVPSDQPAYLWHQWPTPTISLVEYTEKGQSVRDVAVIWPEFVQTEGTAYVEVKR